METQGLLEGLRRGETRALARLISLVEDRMPGYRALIDEVYSCTGKAYHLGITGPPGVGKSTLVDRLIPLYREEGKRVGVLACDPTSPFSGGALLGDRIRMQALRGDEGVFIRSLATRGSLGGLAGAVPEAAILLEAAGYELIVFETIGVGQAEIDVVEAADAVVVVLTPQSGDAIQALKAGLMEIADIFVVNKADQGEADRAVQTLKLTLQPLEEEAWVPPVIKTVASSGEGISELKEALERHRDFLGDEGLRRRRHARLRALIQRAVEEELSKELWDDEGERLLTEQIEMVLAGGRGPFRAAEEIRRRLNR